MSTQASMIVAIDTLSIIATAHNSPYWTNLLDNAKGKSFKGTVQSTLSDPLAYFVVPLAGSGSGGRTDEFTLRQFEFALQKGYDSKADVQFRSGKNMDVINAGLVWTKGKKDSKRLGSLASREFAKELAIKASQGAKVSAIAKELVEAEVSGIFQEDWSASLAIEDLKRRLAAVKIPKVATNAKPAKGRK